jgi:hypothetical protein
MRKRLQGAPVPNDRSYLYTIEFEAGGKVAVQASDPFEACHEAMRFADFITKKPGPHYVRQLWDGYLAPGEAGFPVTVPLPFQEPTFATSQDVLPPLPRHPACCPIETEPNH